MFNYNRLSYYVLMSPIAIAVAVQTLKLLVTRNSLAMQGITLQPWRFQGKQLGGPMKKVEQWALTKPASSNGNVGPLNSDGAKTHRSNT